MAKKSNVKTATSDIDFIYCDNRKCQYKDCLRKISNAPFEKIITVRRYELDKKDKCEGYVVLKGEMEKTNLWDM